MTLTTHTAIGALIGVSVGNPVLGFVLGAASHFLVDIIPHGDVFLADDFRVHKRHLTKTYAYGLTDGAVACLFLVILGASLPEQTTNSSVYIASIVGSVLPDILVGLSDLVKNRVTDGYHKFHFFFHDLVARRYGDIKLQISLLFQVIFIIGVIYFLG